MTASWKVPDEPDEAVAADSKPLLVSLHFLRTTLLRRWRVWVGLACIGMILSLVWTVLVPPPSEGTTSLMLAHESDAEPATAMETDVSLLRTRTVAESVIDELGLNMAPEDFQALVAAEPVTSSVLVLTVQAPDDAAAIARIESLSENFLDFRAEQIESQSKAVVQSYRKRVSELEVKVTTLTNQYRSLTERADETDEFGNPIDPADPEQVSSLLTQRTQVNGEIDELKQAIADASLETGSIVIASHAVDPPSIVPRSPARRLVLAMMSGLIGGAALGIGYVLVVALTTDRIRRREEVASALGTPVRFSAGRPKGRHWWHAWRTRSGASGSRDLEILVRGLDEAVRSIHPEPVRLAVATIGGTEAAERAVTCLATRLAESGVSVVVVDLTEAGRLDRELTASGSKLRTSLVGRFGRTTAEQQESDPEPARPTALRPEGVPTLARGPVTLSWEAADVAQEESVRREWETADVTITLVEVDPAIGLESLTSWADNVIVLVAAGRTSAERLLTSAELIRSTGLDVRFAMMSGTHPSDESLGQPDIVQTEWEQTRRTS